MTDYETNLLDRISELEQQLAALRAEAGKEEKENKSTNKRWRAEKGENYWTVSDYRRVKVDVDFGADSSGDSFRYDTHNYFQTEEEARKYANVLETERQLKKFADEHNDKIDRTNINQENCNLCYNYSRYEVSPIRCLKIKDARVIYFSSKEIAEQAINTIGEEKIKEYLTYEW